MKMSEFKVGKRYRNPGMPDDAYVLLDEFMSFRIENKRHSFAFSADMSDITRDDWEPVKEPGPCDEAWKKEKRSEAWRGIDYRQEGAYETAFRRGFNAGRESK